MEPTYPAGRMLWVTGLPYRFNSPARGDVIAYRALDGSHRLELKRIIGLPNETVAWAQGGRVRINGAWLEERYVRLPPAPPGDDDVQTCVVGADRYFVLGDHRLYSHDSRRYGPIARQAILGKVVGS